MGVGATCIALVTQPTRLEGLIERWSTKSAAKFRFKKFRAHEMALRSASAPVSKSTAMSTFAAADSEADFDLYENEDASYRDVVSRLREELDFDMPVVIVPREHLPNFMFLRAEVIIVVGQDGLVANTAKYSLGIPIVGINPDPQRNDGILLPFNVDQARRAVKRVLDKKAAVRNVTLAEVRLNDGQKLLAFNDFFIGRSGHASARYTLRVDELAEPQSSSGILVSTGAGSTGWISSVHNMTRGIATACGTDFTPPKRLRWEDRQLTWAVREPFLSKHSSCSLVYGSIDERAELVIESLMPEQGVIFSDGVESDFLEFNGGAIARVGVSQQIAKIAVAE